MDQQDGNLQGEDALDETIDQELNTQENFTSENKTYNVEDADVSSTDPAVDIDAQNIPVTLEGLEQHSTLSGECDPDGREPLDEEGELTEESLIEREKTVTEPLKSTCQETNDVEASAADSTGNMEFDLENDDDGECDSDENPMSLDPAVEVDQMQESASQDPMSLDPAVEVDRMQESASQDPMSLDSAVEVDQMQESASQDPMSLDSAVEVDQMQESASQDPMSLDSAVKVGQMQTIEIQDPVSLDPAAEIDQIHTSGSPDRMSLVEGDRTQASASQDPMNLDSAVKVGQMQTIEIQDPVSLDPAAEIDQIHTSGSLDPMSLVEGDRTQASASQDPVSLDPTIEIDPLQASAAPEQTDFQNELEKMNKMNLEEVPKHVEKESSDDGEISDENEQPSPSLPVEWVDSKTKGSTNPSKSSGQILLQAGSTDFEAEDTKPNKKFSASPGRSSEVKGHKAKVKQSEMLLDMHGDELDYEEDVEHGEQQPGGPEEKGEIVEIEDAKEEKKKTSDSELEEGEYDETEDGEIMDDEDEEGEVKDPHGRKPFVRQTCRFYQRGQCTWGLACRFVHPGYNDKGNYMMIERNEIQNLHASILAPPRPPTPPEEEVQRPVVPEEPKVETAWEKGLRHAKELRKKAQIRKEQDEDFEEKRLMAELSDDGDEDYNKENLYRSRDEFYGYHLGEESPVREVIMKEPTLPQQYAATVHVGRINREGIVRDHLPPVTERSYDRYPKVKREETNYNRPDKIRPGESRNRMEPKVPFVNRAAADSWQDPWARARSPKKNLGAKGRRRHSSHSSFSNSSSSRSRSSSYSSYTSHSRSSSSSFSSRSRSRSGSRSSRSYSRSRSRTPSPRSKPTPWLSNKHPGRSGPANKYNQPTRGSQSSRGRPPNRGGPPGASPAVKNGQSKVIVSKSGAPSAAKPSVSQSSKPPLIKSSVDNKTGPPPVTKKASAPVQASKKLSIPPIHFQKQVKRVQPIADHLRPSKERSLSSSSRSSRSSRSSSCTSRSRSRSFSRSKSRSRSRSHSQSYSSISSRSRSPSASRASSVSADSEHMYANLASPVSSASSDLSDQPIPIKEIKVKTSAPMKKMSSKKTSEGNKKPSVATTKTKQGVVKAKPSSSKPRDGVKTQEGTTKALPNPPSKALPKSKAIKPLPGSQANTSTKKTAKVTPMPATSSNIVNKASQKAKQPVPSKPSGTSSAAISHDRSDPLKYSARRDIKLTLLKKPSDTTSKKRALEGSTQSIAKKTKPPSPPTKQKGIKQVSKKSVGNVKPKVSSGVNPSVKEGNVAAVNPSPKAQEKPAVIMATQKAASVPAPAPPKATVTKKGTKSRREELLKQLKEVEEAIARKRAKLAGT